jgi:hypothetical protein
MWKFQIQLIFSFVPVVWDMGSISSLLYKIKKICIICRPYYQANKRWGDTDSETQYQNHSALPNLYLYPTNFTYIVHVIKRGAYLL